MTYSIRRISTEREFAALQTSWEHLLGRSVDANTFLSHAWLHSWWTSYQPRASLAILLSEKAGRLHGIAPMMLSREGIAGRLFRRVRFIGDGTSETDHMNFVVDRDDRAEILEGLLDAVGQLRWDIAHFNHLPESSSNASQLRQYTKRKAWLVKTHTIPCPRRSIPQSVDGLMASLPSRLRTAIRSARRDLEKQHAVEFGLIQKKEEVGGALDALFRNHSGRWQAKGEEGVFVDLRKREFYSRLSERLLEEGSLRFFFLKADGRIIAQQFCFEYDGTVLLLQEGFDIGFSKLNVGNVLRAMVFEYLIEQGAKAYDFLGGMSRHKRSWSDVIANDLSIRACRPTLLGQAAHRAPHWIARLKGQVAATAQEA